MTSHPPSYDPGRGTLTSPDRAGDSHVSTRHEEFLCMSRMLMRRHQCSYRTAMLGDRHRCTGAPDLCQQRVELRFGLRGRDRNFTYRD